ncbi:MAG: MFS transporter, partial [Anaerolineales bacterium]
NRWIRLPLNRPAGLLFERWPRKPLFVLALFLGALSTALYAFTQGFWPLLAGRLLWGIAWVGIWVGGNTIVLDISQETNRGKRVGIYQIAFFTGAGGGAFLGGMLTDWVGYHNAMAVNASLTLLGAIMALIFLPETRRLRPPDKLAAHRRQSRANTPRQHEKHPPAFFDSQSGELASAAALLAVNRLAQAGFLIATMGLFLQQQLGDSFSFAGFTIGIATLTGVGLGTMTLVSIITAPLIGSISDRFGNRWRAAAGGLVPGILGFALLSFGTPVSIAVGLLGISIASGSNVNLSTALIGDLGIRGQHGRRLGALFTIGDLTSAIGPPLAFWLRAYIRLGGVYWIAAAIFGGMWLVARRWAREGRNSEG